MCLDHEGNIPVALCLLQEPGANLPRTVSYPGVVEEALRHWGVPYRRVDPSELARILVPRGVLVTVGEAPAGALQAAVRWVEEGGIWIAIGGTAGVPELFGVQPEKPAFGSWGGGLGMLGEGWMRSEAEHRLTPDLQYPLHFFNGAAVSVTDGTVLAVAESRGGRFTRPAIVETRRGMGRGLLIAPDVPGTIVRIRQGTAITRDGIPAPDGTAPICDGVVKSDDGQVLDWERDRLPVPGAPGMSAFLQPVADLWETLLIRAVLWAAELQGLHLPLLWLHPCNRPAMAVLSHDSDGNDPARARAMLSAVAEAKVRSTWCIQDPGYGPDIMGAIRSAGHEVALHYDAMSPGLAWGEAELRRQYESVAAAAGEPLTSNKNHYLRWEGDVEFFEWCERLGIRVDQSKGASKTGEAGFNFGTCHLYHPVRRDGSPVNVWEMPTPTQDLVVFAPPVLAESLTESVLRVHGILHLLFHPAHIETPGVREALLQAVGHARAAGMEWVTAREAAAWEEARRACRWRWDLGHGPQLVPGSEQSLHEATLLILDTEGDTERLGFRFRSMTLDLTSGRPVLLDA